MFVLHVYIVLLVWVPVWRRSEVLSSWSRWRRWRVDVGINTVTLIFSGWRAGAFSTEAEVRHSLEGTQQKSVGFLSQSFVIPLKSQCWYCITVQNQLKLRLVRKCNNTESTREKKQYKSISCICFPHLKVFCLCWVIPKLNYILVVSLSGSHWQLIRRVKIKFMSWMYSLFPLHGSFFSSYQDDKNRLVKNDEYYFLFVAQSCSVTFYRSYRVNSQCHCIKVEQYKMISM